MNNKLLLGKKELSCTLINLITIKMLFSYPRFMVLNSGNAAWLQCLYVSLIAIIIYLILIKLYEKIGTLSIMELSEKVGGKPLKIIIGLIITITLVTNISINMRLLPESIKTLLLPLTPIKLLFVVFLAAISIGAYLGIYSICRIHALFLPLTTICLAVLFLFIIPYADVNNIYPIFGLGTYNIFVKGLDSLTIFSDIIVLFILMPYCQNFSVAKKSGLNAMMTSAVISFLIVLLYNLVYAYPTSKDFIFSAYQMTRLIKIGDFFQRVEAFFEFIWSILMLLYASAYLFIICHIWKEIFNLKYYREVILPFMIIIGGMAFVPATLVDMFSISQVIAKYTPVILFSVPAVIASAYRIKLKAKIKS